MFYKIKKRMKRKKVVIGYDKSVKAEAFQGCFHHVPPYLTSGTAIRQL